MALTALTPAGGSASDHDAIKAQLSFAGWAQPVETQPAQLAFSGWAQTGAPQPAALAFAGWAQTGTVQTASLSFAGWAQNDRTQEAQLSFSGWALTDEAQEAQLSFTGWAQTNQTQAAQLAFSGWSMGETELDGTLSFAGCTRDDTIPPGPPLPQSTVQAHFSSTDTDPNMDLEGNWIVRWEDAEQSLAHVTLTKGGERLCIASGDGCWIDFTRDPAAPWSIDMVLPGITIFSTEATIGPGRRFSAQYYYSVLGHWGGTSEGTATPDVIVGEWSYGDKNGRETWERVRGRVTGAVGNDGVAAGTGAAATVTSDYSGEAINMRGNRPGASLIILGEKLWGRQRVWIPQESGIEIGRVSYLCEDWQTTDTSYYDGHACLTRGDTVGLRLEFNIWWDAKPGRHYVYVNDAAIPFDLVLRDYPECGV